jgi:hypothetical protein
MESNHNRSVDGPSYLASSHSLEAEKEKSACTTTLVPYVCQIQELKHRTRRVSGSEGLGDMRATCVTWANLLCQLTRQEGKCIIHTTSTFKLEPTIDDDIHLLYDKKLKEGYMIY